MTDETMTGVAARLATAYAGARVIITGGLGFIGANLAERLVELGSEVLLLDSMLPGSGANEANVAPFRHRLAVTVQDIRDSERLAPCLAGRDYLFNLAAQTSHMGSMAEPLGDLDINARAQLALLELCRKHAPAIRIVFASTRQIYGTPRALPVDETHPLDPPDVNAVSNLAAEGYHLVYHRVYGLAASALRLTNTYGPRMRIKDAQQNFLGIWLRRVLEGEPFEIWGGEQLRDFTYVEDAVTAFLLAAIEPAAQGRVFNIGAERAVTLAELARLLIAANGGGDCRITPFPAARKRIDIGDYQADDALFQQVTGWRRTVPLEEGLGRSLDYFRRQFLHYV